MIHVDPDDEITGAIARLRAIGEGHAVMVLPPGSRIATSRINFRLLAREGSERGIDLVVVSDEPGARALAISAGVPAYDSIDAAESALAQFRADDADLAARTGRGRARGPASPDESTRVMPAASPTGTAGSADDTATLPAPRAPVAGRRRMAAPAVSGVATETGRRLPLPVERPSDEPVKVRRRRPRLGPLLVAALLLLVVAGVGYGAYVLLPTATVTLRPAVTTVGPLEVTVNADPDVAVADAVAGIVPAERLTVEVDVSGVFPATGSRVSQSRATGTVRFRSENTVFEVPIPEGTRVSTPDGVAFETTRAVTVARASFAGGPTTVEAPIRAIRGGPRGNVDAGRITRLPGSLTAALVSVRNPEGTSGGRRQDVTVVTQEDYDTALAALTAQLPAELRRVLADPVSTPRGLTLFQSSGQLGEPSVEPAAEELVDTDAEELTLAISTTATVLAVDESLVDQVAQQSLSAQVPSGATVLDVAVERSTGVVSGDAISYRVNASARTYSPPDREALIARLRGVSVSQAGAIMAEYGSAELTVWPEFIDRLPDQPARINVIVLPPQETE